jgi:hypothetical protein
MSKAGKSQKQLSSSWRDTLLEETPVLGWPVIEPNIPAKRGFPPVADSRCVFSISTSQNILG